MTDVANDQTVLCRIANSAFEVVSNLLNRDQLLAETLRSSKTRSHQIFREECITLEMASTLRERFPENVDLTLFTTDEERLNGADWYWRVQKGDLATHALVQAKRVHRSAFGQNDDDGTVELDTGQLGRLVQAANSDPFSLRKLQAWIATFARYKNATPPCGLRPCCCPTHGCNRNCEKETNTPSVWIAQASGFANCKSQSQSMKISELVENSVRLDCILPCTKDQDANSPSGSQGSVGPGTKDFKLAVGLPSFDDCIVAIERLGTFAGALQIKV
jgi:hypothetical protein